MSSGDIFVGEVIGTAILTLFGAGMCAAVTLRQVKASGHLRPAVTFGIASDTGRWGRVRGCLPGQLIGTTALIVSLLVDRIGLSPGGPAGCAINPARDLRSRIVRAFLPIPDKNTPDWGYAWIPVVGPLVGRALAGPTYSTAV
ncbi:aquaporin [Streptomyces sp. NPDC052023]|uniref:aquaporin n=1 Tax=Streptomyces sp. NPDC052023 TaxID=3365681 RepID=UPI0037D5A917